MGGVAANVRRRDCWERGRVAWIRPGKGTCQMELFAAEPPCWGQVWPVGCRLSTTGLNKIYVLSSECFCLFTLHKMLLFSLTPKRRKLTCEFMGGENKSEAENMFTRV